MLQSADTFLGNREKQFPIAHKTSRRIMHLGIVQTECDHADACPSLAMT